MEQYSKYKLYRKYKTEDGVNYTPLDEYQALYESGDGKDCGCGYREYGKETKTDNKKCTACVDVNNVNTIIVDDYKYGDFNKNRFQTRYTHSFNEKNSDAPNTMRSYFYITVNNGGGTSVNKLTLDFFLFETSYLHCTIKNRVSNPKLYDEDGNESELWYSYENGVEYKPGKYRLEINDFYIKAGDNTGWLYLIARTNYVNIGLTESYEYVTETFCPSTNEVYDSTFTYNGMVGYNEECEECYPIVGVYKQTSNESIFVTGSSFNDIFDTPSKTYYYKFDDVNKVTKVQFINVYMTELKQLNIPNLTDTSYMFRDSKYLEKMNISNLDTSKVINMHYMFNGCSSLTSLDVSNFNTSNVTDMGGMFYGCSGLTSLNVSSFDTSNVTNMEGMFYGCRISSLDLSNWNVYNVTDMEGMFGSCYMSSLDLSNWNATNLTDVNYMFRSCHISSLDLSNWNVPNLKNTNYFFYGSYDFTSLDLSGWNIPNLTDASYMFTTCVNLTSLKLNGWNTNKLTSINEMFASCGALVTLDVTGWDISNITNCYLTFKQCNSLRTLILGDVTQETYDWWYQRLVDARIQNNVTIEATIV